MADLPPLPGTAIRPARAADLPGIVSIYNSTVPLRTVTADTEPVSVASRQAWFDAHHPDHHPLWVVEDAEGQLLGWASLSPFYGRPAYAATAEVSIYLAGPARGHGLGRWLLDYVMARSPALGIRTLLGFIFSHNPASLALFARAGFASWGELPDVAELDGTRRSLSILGRHLPDPDPIP
ncbi:N-acetyltransferase family protein [Laribacter hongkongensis]|uniref:N-acetyltransferase family protein n=1 Tax=Laribacter hongkongensis TaxID=168471 RepID=A0ABD4SPA7_9NEIS|nr:GNAT family N-acetyltransferase [Laribacter hongkongensis]MCG9024679.1 N-acetyltransferase family protein [Laribacter hongkongensis]MCG9099713.1 N-acetyltransferase family protein [Laribacter hongkongensis]MCG9104582.1 N-acetyltransferase family protein [Laribacter hongkongensis]MCG9112518.1 N-acetyltransferase family protein [Laribacter hongkongensis]MCG9118288.1 N-acetyltransferase family protein [Laribacter hongkongensis]